MNSLYGMPVIVNPMLDDVPKMRLSESVRQIVTPEFAASVDRWMLDFFGAENRVLVLQGQTFVVGPKTLAALRLQGKFLP
ncbi:hypothetical protein [Massilia sp. BHUDP2]|uniref:hypothetical protein n=1 Tax=Massilia sp. BHUDP2 TaxID=3034505 RepID=UPI003906C3E5